MRHTPLTLCYHAVSNGWQRSLALPASRLLRQVRLVRALGFTPTDASHAVEGRGRLLHVTFDDAFTSIVPVVLELHRLGVGHSVFVCTDLADASGAPLVIRELETEPRRELRTLTWDQLRELANLGTEVYSHTRSHPHLTFLEREALDVELRESRQRIEDELQRPCPYLAYPFGEHDEHVRSAARRAGYAAAFALGRSSISGERYAVPRVGIYRGEPLPRVVAKSTGLVRRRFYSG